MLILTLAFSSPVYANEISVDAQGAVLMDAGSGTFLFEQDANKKLFPASVTKIMTALIAMESLEDGKISLDDQVIISRNAAGMGGSQIYMEPEETKTVEQLLKAILVASGNDASVAIAEHIEGTQEAFVQRMNQRAKELGMKDTNFVNTNGLPVEGHVTSAYDISLMSKELLKHKGIHKWLTTWMDEVVVGKNQSVQQLVNTNRMIRFYDGANGIKTGYTSEAKHCLSASATRGNTTFIAVIMGSPTSPIRFSEAAKLLDYGFANYNSVDVVNKETAVGSVPVEKGKFLQVEAIPKEDLKLLVKKGAEGNVEHEVILPQFVQAPLVKGEKIGEVIVTVDGKEKGRVDLVAAEDVGKASIMDILGRMVRKFVGR